MGKEKLMDKVWWLLSGHLPRMLAYFCVVRVWASVTSGEYDESARKLTVDEALRRWETQP